MKMLPNWRCKGPNEPFWRTKPMTCVRLATIIANHRMLKR
jgi:hypothetical protein